jgi:putative aldouronate transport system permease protein
MIRELRKKYQPWWRLYVFLILPVIWVIIFKYIPMAGVQLAFRKYNVLGGIWNSPWVGLENFERFFRSYQFKRVLTNTLRLSIYGIFAGFPFPIFFALVLNSVEKITMKRIVQTVTYMPHFISMVILVSIMMQIFNPNRGLYGVIYNAITGNKPQDLFSSPDAFVHLYVWSGVWQEFGWGSIMYLAALTTINPELYEAAEMDGASRFQRLLHIELPGIMPTITIMLILRTGSVMSIGFEKVFLMQNDLNLMKSEVISTYEYKRGLASGGSSDFSLSTAIGLFNATINMCILIIVNKIANKLSGTSLW